MEITVQDWGATPKGVPVRLFTLTNAKGNSIALTDYGATWVSAMLPDKTGKRASVVAGFTSLQGYLEDTCYIGASVGRYANRIERASFTIDGQAYRVSANTGGGLHCLHGGDEGLSFRVWQSQVEESGVRFSIVSPDGDQGFPGEANVTVRYHWDDNNKLSIGFEATSTKPSPLSLTNHAYFNLRGEGTILDQELKINASHYLPMKEGCIVTGERRPVEGSVFDFTTFKPIGRDIEKNDEQLILCKGYDESFVIKDTDDGRVLPIAEAYDPVSGRSLKMSSSFPTVHLYTANFLSSTQAGCCGSPYGERDAFCLEAQFAPNSPNIPSFPNCILRPGETFQHSICIEFSTR